MSERETTLAVAPPGSATVEEIAEDMLHVLERTAALEQGLARVADAVAAMDRGLVRSVDTLRRELLDDRRSASSRLAFEALAGAAAPLRTLAHALSPRRDARMLNQVAAALATLEGALQTLGYREFTPAVGEPFDPARMECVGYAPGARGVVLAVCTPGYRVGETLARPAGVLIADPRVEGEGGVMEG